MLLRICNVSVYRDAAFLWKCKLCRQTGCTFTVLWRVTSRLPKRITPSAETHVVMLIWCKQNLNLTFFFVGPGTTWYWLRVYHWFQSKNPVKNEALRTTLRHLPGCAAVLFWPEFSSVTGEIMSNWMGVSGATRASNERTDRAGDGSEPTELMLLVRPVRPLLEWRRQKQRSESKPGGPSVLELSS